jgi:hypothetical protein
VIVALLLFRRRSFHDRGNLFADAVNSLTR